MRALRDGVYRPPRRLLYLTTFVLSQESMHLLPPGIRRVSGRVKLGKLLSAMGSTFESKIEDGVFRLASLWAELRAHYAHCGYAPITHLISALGFKARSFVRPLLVWGQEQDNVPLSIENFSRAKVFLCQKTSQTLTNRDFWNKNPVLFALVEGVVSRPHPFAARVEGRENRSNSPACRNHHWHFEMTRGDTYGPPANVFLPWAFCLIFSEAVGNMDQSLGKLSRLSNLLFNKRYSRKAFSNPHTTYSWLCSSEHTCMKILFLAGFLTLLVGVIYSLKIWGP